MKGFTLIETLVYLALYAVLIAGAFSAAFAFSESSARNETSAIIEEEGLFLVAKINAVLAQAVSVQSPQTTGTILEIMRADGTTVAIRVEKSALRIQANSSPEEILNSANVAVPNLSFTRTTQPASIYASFTLSATTSDGKPVSADFSTLDYLSE